MRRSWSRPWSRRSSASRGLGFEVSERRRHWGARRVVVAAPAGHRIELMEAPPGQAGSGAARRSRRSTFVASSAPLRYPVETFTEAERTALEPHFSNLDRPVFALTNLPETVKGALFARYSRYQGTLRRLYLDEFAADAPSGARPFDGAEGERAAQLYERIFIGYGDDSVAQLGGAHLACEWVCNVLTKVLQRGRLAAYLEQSTRYIAYDAPIEAGAEPGAPGSWRYWRGEELGPEFGAAMDEIFSIYSAIAASTCAAGPSSAGRAARSRRAPGSARSGRRRSTCSAACCPPRPSPTSASTPPGRPTSSSSCGCSPRRCPRPARSARWRSRSSAR